MVFLNVIVTNNALRGIFIVFVGDFERNTGLEPATLGLGSQCSTN